MGAARQWDVFCKVIDNWGDLGVCWRLCVDLATRGEALRLWVDQPAALQWMAADGQPGVQVLPWDAQSLQKLAQLPPAEVLVEAFGCTLGDDLLEHYARRAPRWINLEYLSAEPYVERLHGLPSPVLTGPGKGMTKHFFYPGWTSATGGLLREHSLTRRQQAFERGPWLASLGVDPTAAVVSLFCYEPPALPALLHELALGPTPVALLVTPGRADQAVQTALRCVTQARTDAKGGWTWGQLRAHTLPLLSQTNYDHLLWASDLNFVRGEDSLVRALWAGKPFVWNIYAQDDHAHHAKLEAFLNELGAPPSLRRAHWAWNGALGAPWPGLDLPAWQSAVEAARAKALVQDDLSTQLLRFLQKTG